MDGFVDSQTEAVQINGASRGEKTKQLLLKRISTRIIALLGTWIGLLILFTSQSQYFFTLNNILNIARSASVNGIVAAGETQVLISGGLDLSISSVMAASGMVTAALLKANVPLWLSIFGGIGFGLFIGFINGIIITKMRINPLITTLATMAIVRGAAYVLCEGYSIPIGNDAFREIGRGKVFGIPTPAILLISIFAIAFVLMNYTQFGRFVYAVGGNSDACRLCGLNVDRWRLVTYMLCGTCAALGGIVLAATAGTALPMAALGAELSIISAVILGGTSLSGGEGKILGTLLGMFLLSTLTNGLIMINVPIYWHEIIRGAILLIAVLIDSVRTGGYK